MNNRDILEWYFKSDDDAHIWGTMHGSTCSDELLTNISKKELELTFDADEFIYIWGWPGPDYNRYKFADYGKTWAFTREELPNYKTFKERELEKNKDKARAYKTVFDDLTKVKLFKGIYNAKHGDKEFMHGVLCVMQVIAHNVSDECDEEFNRNFINNLIKSEAKICHE